MTVERRRERLLPEQRIKRRPDYLRVQDHGRRYSGRSYVFYALPREGISASARRARLGITVSKKVGCAVVRNQVKRWLRESYRRMAPLAPDELDLVVIARAAAAEGSYQATYAELENFLRRVKR